MTSIILQFDKSTSHENSVYIFFFKVHSQAGLRDPCSFGYKTLFSTRITPHATLVI